MSPPCSAMVRTKEKTKMTAAAPARVGRRRWGRNFGFGIWI
jgi:hypothetical protein